MNGMTYLIAIITNESENFYFIENKQWATKKVR